MLAAALDAGSEPQELVLLDTCGRLIVVSRHRVPSPSCGDFG
jgi:hypothetical protein